MLFKGQTISIHFSRNVMLTSLVLIGTIAFYNWVVAPHRNYLLAAQRYASVTADLVKKNQIINIKIQGRDSICYMGKICNKSVESS